MALYGIQSEGKYPKGFENKEIFDSMLHLVSSAIITGDKRACQLGLECLDYMIKSVGPKVLQDHSSKLLGILIRVANYR